MRINRPFLDSDFQFITRELKLKYLALIKSGKIILAIQDCTRDIAIWIKTNKLKLNEDKTDLLILNAQHRPHPSVYRIDI